jgi:23S rRNA pseudouridine1911/1915/1917 synthase
LTRSGSNRAEGPSNVTERIRRQHLVESTRAGHRLDQAAAEVFPEFSRARLQAWIREGALTVDGSSGRPAQRLVGGEQLMLDAMPEVEVDVAPQAIELNVIHSDDAIIVLDKPAGLVVHPAAGNPDGTLQNALLFHAPELDCVPRSGIVHRLDKDTSGVMVVARTLQAHAALVRQLQDRSMSRIYQAIVHGTTPPRGTVTAAIGRHPRHRQKMAVVARGKPAVSHFRVLEAFGHFTHLEVSLESGRTHQIRVHMQHVGYPLVGDPAYGKRLPKKTTLPPGLRSQIETFPRQALHARFLRLDHPLSGQRFQFEAPLPPDLEAMLSCLRRDDPV